MQRASDRHVLIACKKVVALGKKWSWLKKNGYYVRYVKGEGSPGRARRVPGRPQEGRARPQPRGGRVRRWHRSRDSGPTTVRAGQAAGGRAWMQG